MLSLRLVVGNVVRTLGSGRGNTLTYDQGQHCLPLCSKVSSLISFYISNFILCLFCSFVCAPGQLLFDHTSLRFRALSKFRLSE